MAKELPYFKFEPNQWENGNIQLCSFEAQGVFINLCAVYWQRLGDLKHRFALMKVCKGDDRLLKELIEAEVIKQLGEDLTINFLDKQLEEFQIISNKRSEAGKKGGDNRILSPEIARIKGNQIYVIHCYNDNEEFIKVGVTSESISRRFSGKMPYEYDVIFQFCTNEHLDLESLCNDSLYSKYAHRPKSDFTGYLECYNMSVFNELNGIIKHRTGNGIAMPKQRNAIRGEEMREDKMREEKKIIKPFNSEDFFATKEKAFDEMRDDELYIEDCIMILSGRGWKSATGLEVIGLVRYFISSKLDLNKPKNDIKQHIKNWLSSGNTKLEDLVTKAEVFKKQLAA